MTPKEWLTNHKREGLISLIGIVVGIFIIAIFFYTPAPKLKDAPNSTKDNTVSLTGIAKPNSGIAVFDKTGNTVILIQTNDKGEFNLNGLPISQGENIFRLRTLTPFWRVSFAKTIKISKDIVAPTLEINPLSQATVTGSNTVITGKAEPGSTVTVNGVQTAVNPDGTWSATVALQSGTNKVTVAATDSAGNTTTNTETVQYTPSATGSLTGTATITTSTVAVSAGSLPATSTVATTATGTTVSSTTPTPGTNTSTTPLPTTSTRPVITPQTILNIVTTAWVSNSSPNDRSNETIYATVKDNFGNPVTNASVIALVYFKTGTQAYSLTHTGNGQYSVSFKLNDKFTSGYKVNIDVTTKYSGFTATAYTSFTGAQ